MPKQRIVLKSLGIISFFFYNAGEGSLSGVGEIRNLNIERIRVLMESRNNQSLQSVQKAIDLYEGCLNIAAIDQQSLTDLHNLILNLGKYYYII